MADEPPVALVELLSKLRLATPEQVRSVRRACANAGERVAAVRLGVDRCTGAGAAADAVASKGNQCRPGRAITGWAICVAAADSAIWKCGVVFGGGAGGS